jgi:hypothetical protein
VRAVGEDKVKVEITFEVQSYSTLNTVFLLSLHILPHPTLPYLLTHPLSPTLSLHHLISSLSMQVKFVKSTMFRYAIEGATKSEMTRWLRDFFTVTKMVNS